MRLKKRKTIHDYPGEHHTTPSQHFPDGLRFICRPHQNVVLINEHGHFSRQETESDRLKGKRKYPEIIKALREMQEQGVIKELFCATDPKIYQALSKEGLVSQNMESPGKAMSCLFSSMRAQDLLVSRPMDYRLIDSKYGGVGNTTRIIWRIGDSWEGIPKERFRSKKKKYKKRRKEMYFG